MLSCFSSVWLFVTLCSLPGSFVHGILQARIIEWVAMPSSRASSWPRDPTHVAYVSCIGKWVLFHWRHLESPNHFFFFICSEFCHTLEWNTHGFTCVPHLDPPSHLPLHPLPLGFPSAPGPSACLMHPTWAGDLFHPRYYTRFDAVLLKHPTLSFSHRV